MTASAESATQVARREARSETNWIATIRFRDGTELPCTVKDVSKSGARIGIPADCVLPDVFMLRIIGRDFLCLVRLAWRRGAYAGVRIERVGKVPAPAAPTEASAPVSPAVAVASQDTGAPAGLRRTRGISSF
ncbi:MAG: PilZ domain-containing protein [Methylobacterium sp.]|uniref:PilZ domain-containing protein n=1 Tax=unclassified Methylobacterium TaxID=2615210 RepID=UPI000AC3FC00|nr:MULTISPECIES: PilZ domain-containing protein [unclassified Methylobacterium]MDO9425683.1 PilZ domain-containing protein [Methylobacterium sp.]